MAFYNYATLSGLLPDDSWVWSRVSVVGAHATFLASAFVRRAGPRLLLSAVGAVWLCALLFAIGRLVEPQHRGATLVSALPFAACLTGVLVVKAAAFWRAKMGQASISS